MGQNEQGCRAETGDSAERDDESALDELVGRYAGALDMDAVHASTHWGDPPRPAPGDPRVVVALDIDGVLNPFAPAPLPRFEHEGRWYVSLGGMTLPAPEQDRTPTVRDGLATTVVHVPAGVSPNPFFAGAQRDIDVAVRFDPAVTAWIGSLHERCEVVWATTWEAAANLFADAAGLPHARVGCASSLHPPRPGYIRNGDAAAWKAEALAAMFDNRPLVWVDDLAHRYGDELSWRHPDDVERTLIVVPAAHVGITAEHMAAIDTFIAQHTP